MGSAHMTDEVDDEVDEVPEQAAPAESAPLTKAEKLEAKAARLREREQAKSAQLVEREQARAREVEARLAAGLPPARQRDQAMTVVAIVLGSLLVVVLVLGSLLVVHEQDLASSRGHAVAAARALDAERQSALTDARQFAIDFGAYDYQTLPADFAKVTSHLTASFAKDYSTITGQLQPTIEQYKAKSTAVVQAAAVSSISSSSAVVIVFLDQTVTSTQSTTATIDRNRLEITLERQKNGSWLVSKLQTL